MDTLEGKVAVITGASSGIGAAIANGLASQGVKLVLVGRNPERLEAVAAKARAVVQNVVIYRADLTQDEAIPQIKSFVEREFGRTDILVHSSGAHFIGKLQSAAVSELDALYRANVRAPYLLTQALLAMIKSDQGQIVFINSSQGLRTGANTGHFSSTQHALKAIAAGFRAELNPDGVRVLSVYPGRTATPRIKRLFELEGKTYRPELLLQPDDVASVVIHALSMPQTAEVTDISIRPLMKSY
jgi:NADP-dependent 3-hydroxy acid dehydrogenase YdfG